MEIYVSEIIVNNIMQIIHVNFVLMDTFGIIIHVQLIITSVSMVISIKAVLNVKHHINLSMVYAKNYHKIVYQ